MKTSRQSNKNHWISVGRNAHHIGLKLELALTKNETVNTWIRDGYAQAAEDRRA